MIENAAVEKENEILGLIGALSERIGITPNVPRTIGVGIVCFLFYGAIALSFVSIYAYFYNEKLFDSCLYLVKRMGFGYAFLFIFYFLIGELYLFFSNREAEAA